MWRCPCVAEPWVIRVEPTWTCRIPSLPGILRRLAELITRRNDLVAGQRPRLHRRIGRRRHAHGQGRYVLAHRLGQSAGQHDHSQTSTTPTTPTYDVDGSLTRVVDVT
jgi:hypothetical protein